MFVTVLKDSSTILLNLRHIQQVIHDKNVITIVWNTTHVSRNLFYFAKNNREKLCYETEHEAQKVFDEIKAKLK